MSTITKNLDRQVSKEVISEQQKQETLNNITTYTSMKEGVKDVELVVEAATENVDLKLNIFRELSDLTPEM